MRGATDLPSVLPAASLPVLVCLVAVGALLWAERIRWSAGVWAFKPLAAAMFVVAALVWGALDSPYGRLVLVGLVLCFVGDVLLIPRRSAQLFRGGILSFLLGHVAYAAAFLTRPARPDAVAVAALLLAAPIPLLLRWLWPHLSRDLRGPVASYVVVITAMVAAAAGAAAATGRPSILAGAVLFAVSDVSVARDRFVAPGFANTAWGLPLYFAAQLILASTVA